MTRTASDPATEPAELWTAAPGCRIDLRSLAEGAVPAGPLVVVDLAEGLPAMIEDAAAVAAAASPLLIGVSDRPLPRHSGPLLDALTTTLAPAGPGRAWAGATSDLAAIVATVAAAPVAATVLAQVLRTTPELPVAQAMLVESLAYSTLLAGQEFAGWRSRTPVRPVPACEEPVLVHRDGDVLEVTLNEPERFNAWSSRMRDGVLAALDIAAWDDSVRQVVLRGNGRAFCIGGDLDEFGTATDAAQAHLVRLAASAALKVHSLAPRMQVRMRGAAIGSGIEIPSFAGRVVAHPGAWFQLPELSMGLIPGAGGTVGITRRVGRWRTAYLALTQTRLRANQALSWGLVDEIDPAP